MPHCTEIKNSQLHLYDIIFVFNNRIRPIVAPKDAVFS